MSAPVPADEVSAQSGPVKLPGVRTGRASTVAGAVAGGFLMLVNFGLLAYAWWVW